MRARRYQPDRSAPDDGGNYTWDQYAGMWVRDDDPEWTDEMEAGLEEHEERKRQRIAEANEY